jgi:hypothetical protein
MNQENRDLRIAAGLDHDEAPAEELSATTGTDRTNRLRFWANWALALLTVVGAGVVMVFSIGAVMSTAACSDKACPKLGPNGISFDVLFYGAPVVAALTIIISFFTAQRRWGAVVPVLALALLIADISILAFTVAQ